MDSTDYINYAGWALTLWGTGFAAGYFFKVLRTTWEKVAGFSSGA